MSADTATTVVWVAPAAPTAAEARALEAWERANAGPWVPPADGHQARIAVDPTVAEGVEDRLERAREALAIRDAAATDAALNEAESIVLAHPEMPQAAWQMAEVQRTRAARWRRIPPRRVDAALRAWADAAILDSGRAPGLGEDAALAPVERADVTVDVPKGMGLWFDGERVIGADATGRVRIAVGAGLHDVIVTKDDDTVWSAWVPLAPGADEVRLVDALVPPCSAPDFAGVSLAFGDNAGVSAAGVRCARWVAVGPAAARGSIRVARCEADRCEPPAQWPPIAAPSAASSSSRGSPAAATEPHDAGSPRSTKAWPAWASWATAGAGALVTAGAVWLVVSALRPPASETRFVNGGLVRSP